MKIIYSSSRGLRDRADRATDPFFSAYLHSIADEKEQMVGKTAVQPAMGSSVLAPRMEMGQ